LIICHLAGLILLQSDFQSWDIIPTQVPKRMIQGGRAQIRATLYMGAVVAMRHNPVIQAFYERLVGRGKSKKLALTACVRKILVILNAMVRQNQPWQQQTIYSLSVPRDSPLTSYLLVELEPMVLSPRRLRLSCSFFLLEILSFTATA